MPGVTGARHRPWKRQPLASRATAVSTIAEIAQRIGSGETCVSTRLPSGAPITAAAISRPIRRQSTYWTTRGSSGSSAWYTEFGVTAPG